MRPQPEEVTAKDEELMTLWKEIRLRHATQPKFAAARVGSTLKNKVQEELKCPSSTKTNRP